jgi:hypothetical protein
MIRLILLTITLALVGCYDPELGNSPFRCAPTGKECPDNYTCDKKTKVCIPDDKKLDAGRPEAKVPSDADNEPSKEGFVYLDGHPPNTSAPKCDDDQEEPNNTADTATELPGPGPTTGWHICYPGDVDHFSIELDQGDKLVVKVKFVHKNGDLDAALLDPTGFVIAMSRGEDDIEELSVSAVTKKGKYVIGVYGFGDATNEYELDLTF